MEWPKRARTADWENGVLALDREKQFEVPKLTAEIMERLAGYTLVGFHVKGYPVTDELLAPFAGHKSMVNFGVENGALTDACFPFFFSFPKSQRRQADWTTYLPSVHLKCMLLLRKLHQLMPKASHWALCSAV